MTTKLIAVPKQDVRQQQTELRAEQFEAENRRLRAELEAIRRRMRSDEEN